MIGWWWIRDAIYVQDRTKQMQLKDCCQQAVPKFRLQLVHQIELASKKQ
jgi:hypothetical protein